jgi:hypothetical protein
MPKDCVVNVRISEENKKMLKLAANDCGTSFSESVLYSSNMFFTQQYLARAKDLQALIADLRPGEQLDKARAQLRSSLDKGEYFISQVQAVQSSSVALAEIDGIEAYREFLSDAVEA